MRFQILFLALLASLSLSVADPECRGGTMNWFTSPVPSDYNLATFVVSNTWRASSFNANPSIGAQLSTNFVFQFGDGNSVAFSGLTITSLDLFQDVLSTTWNVTYRYSTTGLPLPVTFNAYVMVGTRTTIGLKNNVGLLANLATNVVLYSTKSAKSLVLQSLNNFRVAAGATLKVQLYASNSSVNAVIYTKASTALQLGGPLAVTGKLNYLIPSQFSLTSTGLLTFDAGLLGLASAGFYQIQVLATDAAGITVPLDLLVNVYPKGFCGLCVLNPLLLGTACASDSDCCGKNTCLFTPSNVSFVNPSPLNGAYYRIPAYTAWALDMTVADLLGTTSTVVAYASSLPIGASLDVVASLEGKFRFNWLPLITGEFEICFGARQTFGLSLLGGKLTAAESIQGQICVGIEVYNPPCGRGYLNSSLAQCTGQNVVDQALCCLCPSSSGLDPVLGCAFCLLGRFGLGCQECNNCGGHGTCRGGALGSGTCDCDDGWMGVSPPLSSTPSCSVPKTRSCTASQKGFVESADYQLGGTLNPKSASLYVRADPTEVTRLPIRITRPLISAFDFVFLQDVSASTTYSDLTNLKASAATFFLTKGIIGTNTRITFGSFSGHPSSFKLFGPLTDNLDTIVGTNGYLSQLSVNVTSTENYVSSYEATAMAAQSEIGWGTDTYKVIFVLTRKPNNPNGISFTTLSPFLFARSAQPAFLYQGSGIIGIVSSVLGTPYQDDLLRAGFGYSAFLNPFQLAWSVNAILGVTLLQPQLFLASVNDPYNFFQSEKQFWLGLLLNPLLGTELSLKFGWPQNVAFNAVPTQNMAVSVLGYGLIPITLDVNRAPTSSNMKFNMAYASSVSFRIPAQDADQNTLSVIYLSSVSGGSAATTKGLVAANVVSSDFNGAYFSGTFSGNAVFSFLVTDGCLNSTVYTVTFSVAAPPSTLPVPTTTAAPTNAPTTTLAPTDAPTTTSAPTTTAAPSTEAVTTTAAPTDAPTTSSAPTDAPTTASPSTEAATTSAPSTSAASTDAPTTSSAPTDAPTTTASPSTEAATTATPTDTPTTSAPSTEAASTSAPSTDALTTESPATTPEPVTEELTTEPATNAPETTAEPTEPAVETSEAPSTTSSPSTEAATTTAAPSTDAPTTASPSTDAPTTSAPSTEAATTSAPSTDAPTTASPSTEAATTTAAPSTEAATTSAPSTEAATTAAPVNHFPPAGADFSTSGVIIQDIPLSSFFENVAISEAESKDDEILLSFTSAPTFGSVYDSNGVEITIISASTPGKRATTFFSKNDGFQLFFRSFVPGTGSFKFQYKTPFDKFSPEYTGTVEVAAPPTPPGQPPVVQPTPVAVNMDEVVEFELNVEDPVYNPEDLFILLESAPEGQLCLDEALTICLTQGSYFKNAPLYYKGPAKTYGQNFTHFEFSATNPGGLTSDSVESSISINYINKPPSGTFPLTWNVYQNSYGTISLSGTDDHTPDNEILFTVDSSSIASSKGNLSYVSSSSGAFPIETSPFNLPFGGLVLRFAPVTNQYGSPYANFTVTLTDGDGATFTYVITINVIHVNQPPTIFGTIDLHDVSENQNLTIGFGGSDIDSIFLKAYLTNRPIRGDLYTCVQDENGNCTAGEIIPMDRDGIINIPPSSSDNFRWLCVFVPVPDTSRLNYATLSFFLFDEYRAKSGLYIVPVNVLKVNKAPVLTTDGPYIGNLGVSTPLFNNTFEDSDGGQTPERLVITSHSENSTISFNSTAPFQSKDKKTDPDCVQVSNQVINCTAPQAVLRNYLSTLNFVSGTVGNHTVTISVDDLGAGAEPTAREANRIEVSTNVTVSVTEVVAPVSAKSDLTLAIGLGTAGGALGAAGAVGLAAKLIRKPPVEAFDALMEFGADGVNDNPLYQNGDGEAINPLYSNGSF